MAPPVQGGAIIPHVALIIQGYIVTPFFTGIASYFIFREVLSVQQILSGIVLIVGCAILIRARNHFSIPDGSN
jgi:drug/metabolite transporter (DMT)-like permease